MFIAYIAHFNIGKLIASATGSSMRKMRLNVGCGVWSVECRVNGGVGEVGWGGVGWGGVGWTCLLYLHFVTMNKFTFIHFHILCYLTKAIKSTLCN